MTKTYKHGDDVAPVDFTAPFSTFPKIWCAGCQEPIGSLGWAVFHRDHGPVPQWFKSGMKRILARDADQKRKESGRQRGLAAAA